MIVQTQNIQFFKLLHKGLFLFLANKEMLIVNKKLHLQQKVASATKIVPIILIDKEGREVTSCAVDVVTDKAAAPYFLRTSGSTCDTVAGYWRPWD